MQESLLESNFANTISAPAGSLTPMAATRASEVQRVVHQSVDEAQYNDFQGIEETSVENLLQSVVHHKSDPFRPYYSYLQVTLKKMAPARPPRRALCNPMTT